MPLGQAEIVEALDSWAGSRVVMVVLAQDAESGLRPFVGELARVPSRSPDEPVEHLIYSVPTEPRDERLVNPDGTGYAVWPGATGEWLLREDHVVGVSVIQGALRTDFWLCDC